MNTTPNDYYDGSQADDLMTAERSAIRRFRERVGGDDWYGVALSGGGIRSAIFSLGALQALAEKKVLASFDYISSVSGGGYISAALHWIWYNHPNTGTGDQDFPLGATLAYRSGDPVKDARLGFLRSHGQYLIPDEKLSIWSLGAVVVRTLFLNLAVWVPAGAFAYVVLILAFRLPLLLPYVEKLPNLLSHVIPAHWIKNSCQDDVDVVQLCQSARTALAAKSAAVKSLAENLHAENVCTAAADKAANAAQVQCIWQYDFFFNICLWAAFLWIFAFGIWAVAFSLDTRISPMEETSPRRGVRVACFSVALFAAAASIALIAGYLYEKFGDVGPAAFTIALTLIVIAVLAGILFVLQKPHRQTSANYRWRRTFEVYAGASFPWIVILLGLGTVPVLPYLFINKAGFIAKALASAVSLVSGFYAAIFGHRAQTDEAGPEDVSRWVLMLASAIFIYSVAVVSYCVAQLWFDPTFFLPSNSSAQNVVRAAVSASVVVALALMFWTNTNYVGLHRFYRDRLMEAFMPTPAAVTNNKIDLSPNADRISITDLWPPDEAAEAARRSLPYPIINANAIFMNDKNRLIAWRGGDNFILSPRFVGSGATGWELSSRYIKKHGPMSLASAMAASGAAMNANAAYVGAGVTRDRLVSIVLMLLNIRLGMWVGRPDASPAIGKPLEPNHWSPGFRYGMTRSGYTSESPFIELSDGGHFDNSGIYELARRRCKVIVAIDGEEDPKLALPALYSVAQRIREDFKTTIDLDGVLDDLIPEEGKGYPEGVSFVTRPYFVARITYPPADGTTTAVPPGDERRTGVLIYVKLSLAQGLGFDALGYRAQHADFPHQPTLDQFFVPEQVEAYRTVGFVNMQKALNELELQSGPLSISAILDAYSRRPQPPATPPA